MTATTTRLACATVTVSMVVILIVMGAHKVDVPEPYFGAVAMAVLAIFIGTTCDDYHEED
jgi:hypothetical protein